MKKKLTLNELELIFSKKSLSDQTKKIAISVLIDGKKQVDCANQFGISPAAVNGIISRIWQCHEQIKIPNGYEKVTVILPKRKAFIVKQWANENNEKLDG